MEKKASVFRKLTALFLATELLVLLGTGLLLLRYARIQEQGLREESVVQSVQLLEEQLQGAYQVAESLTGDSRLSRIAYHMYPNGYERSQMVLGILDNIRNTCSLNPAIEDIRVNFPSENLELSDSEGYNNNGRYSLSRSTPIGENLFWEDGRLRMKIAHPLISRFMGETPDYECEVVFSKIYTDTILSVFGDGGEQGAVAILNNLGGEVETVFGEARDTEISAAIAGQFGGEAPRPLRDLYLQGTRYAIDRKTSLRYPITLVAWRNTEFLSSNMLFTLVSLTVLVLLTGFVLILVIRQADRHLAKPIYRLMEAFEQVGCGDLSTRIYHAGHDEFDFIYTSFKEARRVVLHGLYRHFTGFRYLS